MSRNYKNIIKLKNSAFGNERRKNLMKEVTKDATPLPQPLEYEDIDKEFFRWVDDDLSISFEDSKLPTFLMVSNQRFSEYMQSWEHVDEKKNLILNFKTITRENNPKPGSIIGETRNIPGDIDFLMKRVKAMDRKGNRYFIEYRVKQPFAVDLIYTVSIFTNKYLLLNQFNQLMNDKFKAIDCYIRPNGHFIPMKLNDISDESEYNLDDRKFYSQSYNITVMAYIMPKESFSAVEVPYLKIEGFEGDKRTKTTVEEIICDDDKYNPYEYTNIMVSTTVPNDKSSSEFNIDCDFKSYKMKISNIKYFELYVNGEQYDIEQYLNNNDMMDENYEKEFDFVINLNKNDHIKYSKISRYVMLNDSSIVLFGYDYTNVKEK